MKCRFGSPSGVELARVGAGTLYAPSLGASQLIPDAPLSPPQRRPRAGAGGRDAVPESLIRTDGPVYALATAADLIAQQCGIRAWGQT